MTKINITKVLPFLIIVSAIFGGVAIDFAYDTDWTTLSRDGDVIAKSKLDIEAERTYINLNSAYRNNVMCPGIVERGGYRTPTRCYYAPDTYEPLKRSLINTKITEQDNEVLKSVPFYAYGTRGSYAGFVKELTIFDEKTTNIEEFPDKFMVTWEPKDTRNYKLMWRLEKLDTSDYKNGEYHSCEYTFGNVKIDLKDECDKLQFVKIEKSKATFYFKPTRFNQILDIGFVDPEVIIDYIPINRGLKVEFISDNGGNRIQYEEPFHISIDASTVQHGWIDKPDNTTVYAVYGKGLFWTDEFGVVPEGNKYFGISFGEKATNGYIKHKKDTNSVWTTIESTEFSHLNNYTFDDNKTYDHAYYTTFANVPANHTRDFKIYVELTEKPERDNFIIYFGTGSTVLEVTIGTDLKVIQTGFANDTDYTASIDVSEGKLFMAQTDSEYDLTSGLVGYWSFDNVDNGTSAWDYSGNNNHGTMTNMNTNLDNGSSGWTSSGNLSYGMNFDGTNDYVIKAYDSSFDITDALTVSMWVYPKTSTDATQALIERDVSGTTNKHFSILLLSAHHIAFRVSNSTNYYSTPTVTYIDEDWYYVTGIYNGTDILLYINGEYKTTASAPASIGSGSGSLWIGRLASVANFEFNGTIDDVRIYNRALSATEISALYNITASDYETEVIELSGSAVTYDVVSNTNTSVIVEVPEIAEHYRFTPTYIRANSSTSTNYTCFNTTDNSFFGNENVGVTDNYDSMANLTRIRINNTAAMSQYDLYNFNITPYLSFSPNDIEGVWYDTYGTTKATSDYSQWVDTCESGNTTGLVGCWNFNEIYGTVAHDRSGNNNDGTLTNMNTGVDNGSSGWTRDGKYGNAVEFDGVNDYITISNSSSTNFTGAFTFSAWVNKKEEDVRYTIYNDWKYATAQERIFIEIYSDNKLKFYIADNTSAQDSLSSANTVSVGWHHITAIYNGTYMKIYLDGTYNNQKSTTFRDIYPSELTAYIGMLATHKFNGMIDEVKIFNRALSAAEILAEYELKKDYFDYMINAEGSLAANENLDIFVSNGTTEPDAGYIWIYPKSDMTSSMWMIDFGLTGGGVSNYDDSCGTITSGNTDNVNTFKNGSYALSIMGEMSPLGNSEKLSFGLQQFPIRYDANSYRVFFQINENLTADTVTQINLNVSEITERTGITTAIDTDTYSLYRISYFGGIYNDTGLCYEQPIKVGS